MKMRKKHEYSVMSDERCELKTCRKRIKLNVAECIKRRPLKCYQHHTEANPSGAR